MTGIGFALARQFRGAFSGLRGIIEDLPDDEWYVGATRDQVPARRAHHAIQWAGRYCRPVQGEHPRARGGRPETAYRGREDMLAYLEDTARQVETALDGTTEEQFADPDLLGHWIYNLRHFQHHVGQLSSTLRERGLPPMKWR